MHFFHVLTKMNYRHMQNALEGINMYIKKPVMYYPKQVRRFHLYKHTATGQHSGYQNHFAQRY